MAPRILVVDDDRLMLALIRRVLATVRYQTWTATSADEVRRLLPGIEDQLDLVLTDVVMPGDLGPEVAAIARRGSGRIRVAYMSSYSESKLRSHGIDLAGASFLPKPFMPETLLAFVAEALGPAGRGGSRPEAPATASRPRRV
jgi:two-component system cell cycle sensor histidine kinase/response regulator CckA